MRSPFTAWLLAAFVLGAGQAAGQNPPPPPPNVASPHATDNGPAGDSAPVTLSGCLERIKPQPTASGSSATPGPQALYALRTATEPGRQATVYPLLAATDAIKLADHLGHRVQITAVMRAATNTQPALSNDGVSPSMRSTGMDTSPRPGTATNEPGPATTIAQPLFVNALKMIDVTCEGPRR